MALTRRTSHPMKVKPSVKKICDNLRHKQRQG
jgi:large subunit ribosomal protein L36